MITLFRIDSPSYALFSNPAQGRIRRFGTTFHVALRQYRDQY